MYIHQHKKWPHLTWNPEKITPLLAEVRYVEGQLLGKMATLGFDSCQEASLHILTQDVLKTSEIEGEILNPDQVRSSLAKRLGINIGILIKADRNVDGIVEIMLDAITHFNTPLSKHRLFAWHQALFPNDLHFLQRISVGKWRTKKSGAMQVASGPIGREKIHYEAPGYQRLTKEMQTFIQWFNTPPKTDLIIQSALAHFWFVTIHPFDDGNGRIARALADMLLARAENNQQRFYSMSAQIQRDRKDYYNVLESCQKGLLDITAWIEWYLNCLKRAIAASEYTLQLILTKASFWAAHTGESFNERQISILNQILDGLLYGKLTSSKWAKIMKCSQDTALRDITDLVKRDVLVKEESGGRSTNYLIKK